MAIQDAREAAEATLASLREAPANEGLGLSSSSKLNPSLAHVWSFAAVSLQAWSSLSEQEIHCAVRPGSLRFHSDTKHKRLASPQYTLLRFATVIVAGLGLGARSKTCKLVSVDCS